MTFYGIALRSPKDPHVLVPVEHNLTHELMKSLHQAILKQGVGVVVFTHALTHNSVAEHCEGCLAALTEQLTILAEEEETKRARQQGSVAATAPQTTG